MSQMAGAGNNPMNESFISPPGLDLSSAAGHGNAVLLAWADGYSPAKSMCQFSTRRTRRNTLWRITLPLKQN
jgi:hypothetical protein